MVDVPEDAIDDAWWPRSDLRGSNVGKLMYQLFPSFLKMIPWKDFTYFSYFHFELLVKQSQHKEQTSSNMTHTSKIVSDFKIYTYIELEHLQLHNAL